MVTERTVATIIVNTLFLRSCIFAGNMFFLSFNLLINESFYEYVMALQNIQIALTIQNLQLFLYKIFGKILP